MVKFSIFRDEEEEEEEDEEYNNHIPKRRRIYNPPPTHSFSSISSPTAPFIQQQQQEEEEEHSQVDGSDFSVGVGVGVGPTSSKSGGPINVILSDPDVLDCSICFNPLTVPVFQCDNGHIACSSCCKNLGNKCPSCCGKIGNNRCRAIEKVIESVQVSCCYLKHGCQETINYCDKQKHEDNCTYAPCSCPFPDCHFQGSPRKLSHHVVKEHTDLVIHFRYDSAFPVFLRMDTDFVVLREESDGVLLILSHGNTTAIRCIDPNLSNGTFAYDLVLRRGSTSLKFQSFTHCTTGRFNDLLSDGYILIPGYFYPVGGLLELEICIQSKDAFSHTNIT